MPPPQSRGRILVDLVNRRPSRDVPSPPTDKVSRLDEEKSKTPLADTSLPNISISEQDLQNSIEFQSYTLSPGLFSETVSEDPMPSISAVIEFIEQAEMFVPEPGDVLIDLNTESVAFRHDEDLETESNADTGSGALRHEEDLETESGALRRNEDLDTGSSALRHQEDLQTESNALRRNEELDTGSGALRHEEDLETESGALRRNEDLDTGSSALRHQEDLQTESDALRRNEELDTGRGALRHEEDLEIESNAVRCNKDLDTRTGALRHQEHIERTDLEDPDFISETDGNHESDRNEGRAKRGRKRKYAEQNRSIRKEKANKNFEYISATGKTVNAREFKGHNFNCNCPRKCTERLTLEQRENEFKKFWSSGSYEARCAILQGCVREANKLRSYSADSKRQFTRRYFLADNISICKKTFLNTLGISQSRIDVALKKFKSQAPINDNRGVNSGGRNVISQTQRDEIKDFIKGLPKYKSHYCRDNTTAHYLAPNLNLAKVYDLYKEKHQNSVSLSRFKQCFYKDFNLRFKKPQKDTCLRCDRFKASTTGLINSEQAELLQKEHKEHLDHAYKLRDQMKKDLARAKVDSSLEALTFDLEKTHCLPRLPTSIVYYKRQLNLHNLGIHCGSTAKGFFFIWLEHEAGRGTQEVGSCIKKFLDAHLKPNATELILWADSCGGQNRSIKMVLMLLNILHTKEGLQKITLRFLQPGHTYLPNDSEFGDVECALKSQIRLYTVDDYISVMENCRRKNKFTVTRLQKEDFKSVAPILDRVTNRKMDITKQKISWLTTCEIELRKDDPLKLFMKTKLENDFKVIDISKGPKGRKVRPNFEMNLPVLYPDGHELSSAKVNDLKEMMKLIPADAKPFYNFLRIVRSSDFTDDTEGFGNTIDFEIEGTEQEQ